MEIIEKYEDHVLVLKLTGELMGGSDADKFRKIIDKAIENEQVFVIADMSDVTWMNSSGLGMLISALTSLRSSGGDLFIAHLSERLRRPIQITKLDSVIKEFATVQDAVKAII
jgi:anti-sigma B factor antagonist